MSNPLTSGVTLQIDGVDYCLRFTLGALGKLQSAVGANGIIQVLDRIGGGATDVIIKAIIASATPKIDFQGVESSDLVFGIAMDAVRRALNLSLFGSEVAPKSPLAEVAPKSPLAEVDPVIPNGSHGIGLNDEGLGSA